MEKKDKVRLGLGIFALVLLLAAIVLISIGIFGKNDIVTYIGEGTLTVSTTINLTVNFTFNLSNINFSRTITDNRIKIKKMEETINNFELNAQIYKTEIYNMSKQISTATVQYNISQVQLAKNSEQADKDLFNELSDAFLPIEMDMSVEGCTFERLINQGLVDNLQKISSLSKTSFFIFEDKALEPIFWDLVPLINKFVDCFYLATEERAPGVCYRIAKWVNYDRKFRHKDPNYTEEMVKNAYDQLLLLNQTYVELINKFYEFVRTYKR